MPARACVHELATKVKEKRLQKCVRRGGKNKTYKADENNKN